MIRCNLPLGGLQSNAIAEFCRCDAGNGHPSFGCAACPDCRRSQGNLSHVSGRLSCLDRLISAAGCQLGASGLVYNRPHGTGATKFPSYLDELILIARQQQVTAVQPFALSDSAPHTVAVV